MNADEIVMALRKEDEGWMGDMTLFELHQLINKAADLIESMQAQLSESQRREMAAVELAGKLIALCDAPNRSSCTEINYWQ